MAWKFLRAFSAVKTEDAKRPHETDFITGQTYNTKRGIHTVPATEYRLQHAIEEILDVYGDTVYIKPKRLLKFGRSVQVSNSTHTTLMELPTGTLNETYVTDNLITTVSSSDTNDTQSITIEGHTLSGGNFTFVTQTLTLQGQTQVSLATPLARSTRIFNAGSTDFAGDIAVYETDTTTAGVPDTDSKVHLLCRGTSGHNQSFKASTTISSQDYWIITEIGGGVEEKTSVFVDIDIEVRQNGFVFRTQFNFDVSSQSGEFRADFNPPLIIPKNSDVRMRALSSAVNTSVSGFMNGYLALIDNS